jgi:hypothetical protein
VVIKKAHARFLSFGAVMVWHGFIAADILPWGRPADS